MLRPIVAISLALSLGFAGCLASGGPGADTMEGMDMTQTQHTDGHGHSGEPTLDTGLIEPGANATLRFDEIGAYSGHCHPHPWMLQNVTAEAGAPTLVHVDIVDGKDTSEFGFRPSQTTVAPGGSVMYHNVGVLAHTATLDREA
ncbi:MAG: hypothetical protein WDA16_00490 [Candidatus Thermoplasmatota archaeon]